MAAYCIIIRNACSQVGEVVDCESDMEALEKARALVDNGDFEIWQGLRKVVSVDRGIANAPVAPSEGRSAVA